MSDKIKTSLFGYSKKSVDELQSEYDKQIKALQEEINQLAKQNKELKNENKNTEETIESLTSQIKSEQENTESVYAENKELKNRLTKTVTELEKTTTELFEIKKQSSEIKIAQELINNNSKLITQDIIKDSYDFDELMKSLKSCNDEMKNYCDKAENVFNDIFIKIAEFIISTNGEKSDENAGNSNIIAL